MEMTWFEKGTFKTNESNIPVIQSGSDAAN